MSKRLRIAAVGAGYFSTFHFDAWGRCPEAELIAIADRDGAVAENMASDQNCRPFTDAETMLEEMKPDLLDIITPPQTHLEMIALAAKHGTNVICQKPFCGSLSQAKEAVEIGSSAGIDITVHENFRFQPWYHAIRRELDADRLGDIFQITFRLRPGDGQGPDAYLDRQPYFQTMERFVIHETAIHLIDVFRYLAGDVRAVWADLARLNPAIAGEDAGIFVLQFDNNVRGVLDANRLSDHKAENRRRTMGEMIVEGSKGVLTLDGDGTVSFRGHGSNRIQPVEFDWNDIGFGGDCVYHFTRHVVDHYVNGTPLMNSAIDYIANLEIEEAIYASAADGVKRML